MVKANISTKNHKSKGVNGVFFSFYSLRKDVLTCKRMGTNSFSQLQFQMGAQRTSRVNAESLGSQISTFKVKTY